MSEFYDFPKIFIDGEEFWQIESVKNLKMNAGKAIRLGDELDYEVAVFLVEGEIFCLSNVCPHRHQNHIAEGIVKDEIVTCPLHFWSYDLRTGKNINKSQGTRSLQSFEVRIIDGFVYLKKPDIKLPKWREI